MPQGSHHQVFLLLPCCFQTYLFVLSFSSRSSVLYSLYLFVLMYGHCWSVMLKFWFDHTYPPSSKSDEPTGSRYASYLSRPYTCILVLSTLGLLSGNERDISLRLKDFLFSSTQINKQLSFQGIDIVPECIWYFLFAQISSLSRLSLWKWIQMLDRLMCAIFHVPGRVAGYGLDRPRIQMLGQQLSLVNSGNLHSLPNAGGAL